MKEVLIESYPKNSIADKEFSVLENPEVISKDRVVLSICIYFGAKGIDIAFVTPLVIIETLFFSNQIYWQLSSYGLELTNNTSPSIFLINLDRVSNPGVIFKNMRI